MLQNKYVLEFLPMFYDDLEGIVDYITIKLKNPDAADDLVEAVFERSEGSGRRACSSGHCPRTDIRLCLMQQ